jgi:GH24 family phage-related lysozyme (muramidase)
MRGEGRVLLGLVLRREAEARLVAAGAAGGT